MDFHPVEFAKAHPYLIAGGVVAIGAVILLGVHGGGSTAVAANPNAATDSALTLQQDNNSAAAASQAGAEQFQLANNAQVIAGNIGLKNLDLTAAQDQIAAELQATQANDALSAYQIQTNATVQDNATAASLAALKAQLDETSQIATIQSATATSLATINANVQTTQAADYTQLQGLISANQTAVAINQTNSNVQIAGINASAAKAQAGASQSNGIFGFLGSLALAFL